MTQTKPLLLLLGTVVYQIAQTISLSRRQ